MASEQDQRGYLRDMYRACSSRRTRQKENGEEINGDHPPINSGAVEI